MRYVSLIGAIVLGLLAVFTHGFTAMTAAILAAGLFVSSAIYSLRPTPVRAEASEHTNNKGWLGMPDWVA